MIYLDNAATTLKKPDTVAEAVSVAIKTLGNPGRAAHDISLDASRVVLETRALMARLINAESPDRIAFTMNATESLNTAIKGCLKRGDVVITTCLEHNSVLRPLYETVGEENMIILDCDGKGMVYPEDFKEAVHGREVAAVICTHASNVTGNALDIRGIGEVAREIGALFMVDASQSAGELPVDVQACGVDILCFTGHKALFGPQGTGGIYVRRGVDIKPLKTGGGGSESFLKTHPREMPGALEAGTQNAHGIAGLKAGLEFLLDTGIDNVQKKGHKLLETFIDGIKDIPDIRIYGDLSQPLRAPIVSLNLGESDSAIVCFELSSEYGIYTRTGAHCAPLMHEALGTKNQGAVRFSFSYFNTEDEARTAARALREITKAVWHAARRSCCLNI